MIYLMSPYTSHDPAIVEERVRMAARCVAWYHAQGKTCVSPVVHCHETARLTGLGTDWATWSQWCHDMLHECVQTAVLCLPGWERSKGVSEEIEIAHVCGKPIRYISPGSVT